MKQTWEKLLTELEGQCEALRVERENLLRSFLSSGPSSSKQSKSFYIDETPIGSYTLGSHFDWKGHFGLSGRPCVSLLPTLYPALLYYDTLITHIYPCPIDRFDQRHAFKFSELEKICSLHEQKRVILTLALSPLEYREFPYLQPLFERIRPLQLPWMPERIQKEEDWNMDFEKTIDNLSEIPGIKRAIMQMATNGGEDFKSTEHGMIVALLELNDLGFSELKTFALNILLKDPAFGLHLIYALKRLLVNPINFAPGIPHCWSHARLREDYWLVGRGLKLRNISVPGEIGAILETKLSFPTPASWEGLQWCEENLDITGIRNAFATLERTALGSLARDGDCLGSVRDIIETNWNERIRATSRLSNLIYWGTTLSIGALGTLVSGPLVGFLSSLGLTAVSNIMIPPFTRGLAKTMNRSMFHLWDLDERRGR